MTSVECFAAAVADHVPHGKPLPTPMPMLVGYLRIARGLTNTAIAERRCVSVKTVEAQLQHLAKRLGYDSWGAMRRDLSADYHQRVGDERALRELVTA